MISPDEVMTILSSTGKERLHGRASSSPGGRSSLRMSGGATLSDRTDTTLYRNLVSRINPAARPTELILAGRNASPCQSSPRARPQTPRLRRRRCGARTRWRLRAAERQPARSRGRRRRSSTPVSGGASTISTSPARKALPRRSHAAMPVLKSAGGLAARRRLRCRRPTVSAAHPGRRPPTRRPD